MATILKYNEYRLRDKNIDLKTQQVMYDYMFNGISCRAASEVLGISHQQVINNVQKIIRLWATNDLINITTIRDSLERQA